MNEREHGRMWEARCICIEVMLANIFDGDHFKWSEIGALYRALLVGYPTVSGE